MKQHKRNSKSKQRQKSPRRGTGRKKPPTDRWVLTKRGERRMPMFKNGKVLNVAVSHRTSTAIGQYLAAVKQFLDDQNRAHLKPYRGKFITDLLGKKHRFEVRANHLYRIALAKARS